MIRPPHSSTRTGTLLPDTAPSRSRGMSPSGNSKPERTFPAVFGPVPGSAPDIAGQGIANPVGQIWAGAMMLDHLGCGEAGAAIVSAIETVLAAPRLRTRDLGGSAGTEACGKAVADALLDLPIGQCRGHNDEQASQPSGDPRRLTKPE